MINNHSAKIVVRSVEVTDELDKAQFTEDYLSIAGKAAGICYMPDDYLDSGIQNKESAIKRAGMNARSGHYSVYEHAHVTFIIKTSKMMAMILNSTGLYSTSEKSARYTKMVGLTDLENEVYLKWTDIYKKLISIYYPKYTENEIEKLALENARYLLSVFTPTVMEFTVPHGRAMMLPIMLKDLAFKIQTNKTELKSVKLNDHVSKFFDVLSEQCVKLADKIIVELGGEGNIRLTNHKEFSIDLFAEFKSNCTYNSVVSIIANETFDYYNDNAFVNLGYSTYETMYNASFAELAQAHRHRTLNYDITFKLSKTKKELLVYIPRIIRNTPFEREWIEDFQNLVENDVIPQGTILNIYESGQIKNFILKAKERMCSRAQLEIAEVTSNTIEQMYFALNRTDSTPVSKLTKDAIKDLVDENGTPTYRCKYSNYLCKEQCDRQKELACRFI